MGMNNIVKRLKFILPKNFVQYLVTDLAHIATILIEQYSNDLSL